MLYHYESTSDFQKKLSEIDILLEIATTDDENKRDLLLKLSVVTLVTKFQVFVEKILSEFKYNLKDKPSGKLSTYMKLNSLRLSLEAGNPLIGLSKHNNFTEEKKKSIENYLKSIRYLEDDSCCINENFFFNTRFPMGKTGKNELINLFKQIDGNESPFDDFGIGEFNKLDSILQIRHAIIHQDRFNGTEETVKESLSFFKALALYIDEYLAEKIKDITG